MNIIFTTAEIQIFLGGWLMYWGVPFHKTTKQVLPSAERLTLDSVRDRLLLRRNQLADCQRLDPKFIVPVEMSLEECELYARVLASDLEECVGLGGDRELEIHVGRRPEVEACLDKLRTILNGSKRPN